MSKAKIASLVLGTIGAGFAAVAFKRHSDQQDIKADEKNGYGLEIDPSQFSGIKVPRVD